MTIVKQFNSTFLVTKNIIYDQWSVMWFDSEPHSTHIFFLRIIGKRVSSILFSNQLIVAKNSPACAQLHLEFRARNIVDLFIEKESCLPGDQHVDDEKNKDRPYRILERDALVGRVISPCVTHLVRLHKMYKKHLNIDKSVSYKKKY